MCKDCDEMQPKINEVGFELAKQAVKLTTGDQSETSQHELTDKERTIAIASIIKAAAAIVASLRADAGVALKLFGDHYNTMKHPDAPFLEMQEFGRSGPHGHSASGAMDKGFVDFMREMMKSPKEKLGMADDDEMGIGFLPTKKVLH